MPTPTSQKRPHVCFLDQSGKLGGAELCLLDLVRKLKFQATVILFEEGPFADSLREASVEVKIIPLSPRAATVSKESSPWRLFSLLPDLWRHHCHLREALREADLIYLNTPKAAVLGGWAARREGRVSVYHLHDLLTTEHFSLFNRRLLVGAANRSQAVLANSEATLRAYREGGGTCARARVIPNGFSLLGQDALPHRESCRKRLEAELGITSTGPLLAIFGRISPWKGQHVVLQALEQLPTARLLIVGEALFTAEDRAYGKNLHTAGMEDRVHFLGFRQDVLPLMRAVDVVIHASTAPEPFGRVIVEAMLAETPILATGAGGAKEIIQPCSPEWLLPPADSVLLARAIERILDDPATTAAAVTRNRHSAEERFALPVVLEQTHAFLAELLGSGVVSASRFHPRDAR
jgi:glycosyltransferase involved in cell wall biosynthesis